MKRNHEKNKYKRFETNKLYHNVTTIEVYTYRLTFPRPIKFHPFLTSQAEGRGVCLHIIKSSKKGRRIFWSLSWYGGKKSAQFNTPCAMRDLGNDACVRNGTILIILSLLWTPFTSHFILLSFSLSVSLVLPVSFHGYFLRSRCSTSLTVVFSVLFFLY